MINFGIDLGTTNSAISKYDKGTVEVFRNPGSLKQTLPSVVAFRRNRVIVGDKAREYLEKDPHNVVGSFKRKMGTSETYQIESLGESKTPIDLSAYVLKELKNFVHTGEVVDAAVITIPASFDTIQSNATRQAGLQAGFSEVHLLQEPIAASLAYANKDEEAFEEGRWIVYDLGGGTFDVAIVRIQDGEMRILDHEGDNFLGGTDFDNKIVEKILIPWLEKEGSFQNLEQEMKSASGKYNKLYYKLLHLAEEAKILLSNSENADVEFECEDDKGNIIDGYVNISRQDFNALLLKDIDRTVDMIQLMLQRNNIDKSEVKFALMVGGSTYIPIVRERIAEQLEIEVNCNIDPTTAVAVGAAYFAGTKRRTKKAETPDTPETKAAIHIKTAYQKASKDEEEVLVAEVKGDFKGLFYRITREDAGFDSGLKPLEERLLDNLPLAPNTFNVFTISVFDEFNNPVPIASESIGISQGTYAVAGQPLPHDICLEVDDLENNTTALEIIFAKNDILPAKKTLLKEITRTIPKGSDQSITINILEGPAYAMPSANQIIGFITITGKELERDLVKGSDVEIILEMSESRDLKINTYLMLTDQEYENSFMPTVRNVNMARLGEELILLQKKAQDELFDAEMDENYELAKNLNLIVQEVEALQERVSNLRSDDVTDEKFQIDDKKRKLAQDIDNLTKDKNIIRIKMEYFEDKRAVRDMLKSDFAQESDSQAFESIVHKEKSYLQTNSSLKIQELIDQMSRLKSKMYWRDPQYVISLFYYFVEKQDQYSNPEKGQEIIRTGEKAISEENYDRLRVCVNELYALLPKSVQRQVPRNGTGIG